MYLLFVIFQPTSHKSDIFFYFFSKALGDDRRSFSYYKAIPVIEKLPFKIESVDQVKNLAGIGKSMQDHVSEHVDLLSWFHMLDRTEREHIMMQLTGSCFCKCAFELLLSKTLLPWFCLFFDRACQ